MDNNSQDSRNAKLFVVEGGKIGRLSVGPLVFNVRDHELFVLTPISYVRQGRLRECVCDCGERKLIAEKILETGRVRSCGCLKKEKSVIAAQNRNKYLATAEERKRLTQEIRSEQNRLKWFQSQYNKDEEKITQISDRIKELMRIRMAKVNYKKNAKERIRKREAKLLESVLSDSNRTEEDNVPEEQPE